MTLDRRSRDEGADLEREAFAWVVRVTDDDATSADRADFQRWQATSPAHARAAAKATSLWQAMPVAIAMAGKSGELSLAVPAERTTAPVDRRSVIIGFATAAAAAVCGYAVIQPPLGLWPSLVELTADYRTATGQQRRIDISDAVSVEMNTQTSIALRPTTNAFHRFELIAGEAIVDATKTGGGPLQVVATNGVTTADGGNFDIRCEGGTTSVTCLVGEVRVQHQDHTATLQEGQQVSYGEGKMSPVTLADPAVITAWRNGYLMFRKEPLARVIAEVNRYRPGRIVLIDDKLGQGLVTARFKLDRLDDVLAQIREVFGAPVRILPGGLVLIG